MKENVKVFVVRNLSWWRKMRKENKLERLAHFGEIFNISVYHQPRICLDRALKSKSLLEIIQFKQICRINQLNNELTRIIDELEDYYQRID